MLAKIHSRGNKSVLAACDSELLGKTLSKEIGFRVSEAFYGGKKVGEKEFLELLEEHENANLVGKKCVNAAIQKGLIKETSVIKVGKVPHAQIFKVPA